jgi:hypothetical protein
MLKKPNDPACLFIIGTLAFCDPPCAQDHDATKTMELTPAERQVMDTGEENR